MNMHTTAIPSSLTESPFMVTASGRKWPYLDPAPTDVCFRDIAEMLARTARYGGATEGAPYSVAQHCVEGLKHCTDEVKPYFLLHDAHEAYIGDLVTPLQWALCRAASVGRTATDALSVDTTPIRAIRTLKAMADTAIHRAAGLEWPMPAEIAFEVRKVDRLMLGREVQWLMPAGPGRAEWLAQDRKLASTPRGRCIIPWHWEAAAEMYRQACAQHLPALHQASGRKRPSARVRS